MQPQACQEILVNIPCVKCNQRPRNLTHFLVTCNKVPKSIQTSTQTILLLKTIEKKINGIRTQLEVRFVMNSSCIQCKLDLCTCSTSYIPMLSGYLIFKITIGPSRSQSLMKWIYKEPPKFICPLTTSQINPKTPSLKIYESQRKMPKPKH